MTHKSITSKTLRTAYASELWQARAYMRHLSIAERGFFRFGLESGFWAMQKVVLNDKVNRAV